MKRQNQMDGVGNNCAAVDGLARKAATSLTDEYSLIRNSITHSLQHGVLERVDTNYVHGAIENVPRLSGAIFLSLHPKQLAILIADARTSIVLAVQRHLHNEQYRRRLTREFHYRALRPHLSDSFRLLMVPFSNSNKYAIFEGRGVSLAIAYQNEIEHLESEFFHGAQQSSVEIVHESRVRTLKLAHSRG